MKLKEGRGVITKGCKTSTGGMVLQGNDTILFTDTPITTIHMKASCPLCKKGVGRIVPLTKVNVRANNVQIALHDDIVLCQCPYGSNTVIANSNAIKFHTSENGDIQSDYSITNELTEQKLLEN